MTPRSRIPRFLLLIAEPRIANILQFFVYLSLLTAGLTAFVDPPTLTLAILGPALTGMWATFLTFGGLIGAVAVLPGWWWLERVGLIAAGAGLLIYGVILLSLQSVETGSSNYFPALAIACAFLFAQAMRWNQIRGLQLAPRS
jgi:hypothetical protein